MICDISEEKIPNLVRVLYSNLNYFKGSLLVKWTWNKSKYILKSLLRTKTFYVPVQSTKLVKKQIMIILIHDIVSFLDNPSAWIPTHFKLGSMLLDICLAYFVATHILIPRKHTFGKLTKTNVAVVWQLANKMETNWFSAMIHRIMDRKIKNMLLSFDKLVTKI